MQYVLFYDSADDVRSKAPLHAVAHRAHVKRFHARGDLMIGTFANPQEEGSLAICTTRDAAEEFVRGDPFVLYGVVRSWHVRAWNEALTAP